RSSIAYVVQVDSGTLSIANIRVRIKFGNGFALRQRFFEGGGTRNLGLFVTELTFCECAATKVCSRLRSRDSEGRNRYCERSDLLSSGCQRVRLWKFCKLWGCWITGQAICIQSFEADQTVHSRDFIDHILFSSSDFRASSLLNYS